MFHCAHCGSRNHASFDCPTPHLTYTPTAAEMEEAKPRKIAAPDAPQEPDPVHAGPAMESPRWPGGPPICAKENRPAFKDRKCLAAFCRSNRGTVAETRSDGSPNPWECAACGALHAEFVPHSPSGDTSGRVRDSVYPRPNFRPFVRKRAASLSPQANLPKRPEEELKKPIAIPPPEAHKRRRDSELF